MLYKLAILNISIFIPFSYESKRAYETQMHEKREWLMHLKSVAYFMVRS